MQTFLHLHVTSSEVIFAINSSLYCVSNIEVFVIHISCEKNGNRRKCIVLMEKLKFGISTCILE